MPIFEYACNDCGKKFEELVNSGSEKMVCPSCQSTNTLKLISVFAATSTASQSAGSACSRPGCGSGFS